MADELRGLEELLTSRIGLDPSLGGLAAHPARVKQRMRDLKLDDLAVYERSGTTV